MTGYDAIKVMIYKQLTQANADVPGGRNKFSKDLAKRIHEEFMNDRDYSQPYEFPADLLPICERLKDGLKLGELKRTEEAAKVYRWLKEQDDSGKSLDRFVAWANSDEQKKYMPKYYANPEWLKVDYPRAFENTSVVFTKDESGGMYV